jgi:hypothetical protein
MQFQAYHGWPDSSNLSAMFKILLQSGSGGKVNIWKYLTPFLIVEAVLMIGLMAIMPYCK